MKFRQDVEGFIPIPEYEDYFIHLDGTVMSTKNGKLRRLKPSLSTHGYPRVSLWKEGKGRFFMIHRLLMLVFVGPSDLHINHINNIRTDTGTVC